MSINGNQLLTWPLGGVNKKTGRLEYSLGDSSLRESMINILLTRPGERLMRPEFGAGLQDFIHQPNNLATRSMMQDRIGRALARWEPRLEVQSVLVSPSEENLAEVVIEIHYRSLISNDAGAFGLRLNLAP